MVWKDYFKSSEIASCSNLEESKAPPPGGIGLIFKQKQSSCVIVVYP